MSKISAWFRNLAAKSGAAFRRFMEGRYGTDKLNMFLLRTGLVLMLISILLPSGLLKMIFWLASYGLMIWAICRMLSRNIYKRYEENRKYLQFFDAVKDKEHRYFNCPRCRQRVRVPRGKGKISITCPKCREKFIKKT